MSEAKFGDQATLDESTNAAETIARASSDVIRETSEWVTDQAREGSRRAAAASVGAEAAIRAGSSLAEEMRDIPRAWARCAEEVMRQTFEASRALIGCQTLSEMVEIQSRLLRGNMQALLDQSSEMAEIAGRMAIRPLQALKQAGEAQSAR
jgi:hypothetical protein